MARKCAICGKTQLGGYLVSHSHVRTHRRWNPNLRIVNASVNGVPRRVRVCTRCLRSGKVQRKIEGS